MLISTMGKPSTIPVSTRALFQRLSRRLAKDGKRLMTCREDSRAFQELGRYYTVNERNHIDRGDIDLEEFGRELGVLTPWEKLADE